MFENNRKQHRTVLPSSPVASHSRASEKHTNACIWVSSRALSVLVLPASEPSSAGAVTLWLERILGRKGQTPCAYPTRLHAASSPCTQYFSSHQEERFIACSRRPTPFSCATLHGSRG